MDTTQRLTHDIQTNPTIENNQNPETEEHNHHHHRPKKKERKKNNEEEWVESPREREKAEETERERESNEEILLAAMARCRDELQNFMINSSFSTKDFLKPPTTTTRQSSKQTTLSTSPYNFPCINLFISCEPMFIPTILFGTFFQHKIQPFGFFSFSVFFKY